MVKVLRLGSDKTMVRKVKIVKNIFKFVYIYLIIITNSYADATGDALKDTGVQAAKGAAVGAAASYGVSAAANASQSFGQMSEGIGKFFASPLGVGIVSGIGLTNSMILRSAAQDQSVESEKNIKKIEELMAAFKDSYKCINGRSDLKEPQCYCYNEDGTKNSNRSNSQTCQTLWASQDYLIKMSSESFKNSDGTLADVKGCVTYNNQFDEGCKCKRMINGKGENACKKISAINVATLGSASALSSNISNLTKTLSTLAQGGSSLGRLDSTKMAVALKNQYDHSSKIFEAVEKQKGKLPFPVSNATLKKYQDQLFTEKGKQAYNNLYGAKNSFDVPLNSNSPAMQKAVDQLKKAGVELSGSGKGIPKKSEGNKDGFQLNFNDNQASNSQGGNAVEFAEKNYNYKEGQVNKDPGASLFEIISHRYIESGIRRLFEDEVK